MVRSESLFKVDTKQIPAPRQDDEAVGARELFLKRRNARSRTRGLRDEAILIKCLFSLDCHAEPIASLLGSLSLKLARSLILLAILIWSLTTLRLRGPAN